MYSNYVCIVNKYICPMSKAATKPLTSNALTNYMYNHYSDFRFRLLVYSLHVDLNLDSKSKEPRFEYWAPVVSIRFLHQPLVQDKNKPRYEVEHYLITGEKYSWLSPRAIWGFESRPTSPCDFGD